MKIIKTFESFIHSMNPAEFSKPNTAQANAMMYNVLKITPEGIMHITNQDYNNILDAIPELYYDLTNNETLYPTENQNFTSLSDQIVFALCKLDKLDFFTSEDQKTIYLNDREKIDMTENEFTSLVLSMYQVV